MAKLHLKKFLSSTGVWKLKDEYIVDFFVFSIYNKQSKFKHYEKVNLHPNLNPNRFNCNWTMRN